MIQRNDCGLSWQDLANENFLGRREHVAFKRGKKSHFFIPPLHDAAIVRDFVQVKIFIGRRS